MTKLSLLLLPLTLIPLARLQAQAPVPPTPAPAPAPAPPSAPSEEPYDRSETSLAYFGSFPSAADGNQVHQGASSSWGLLADGRWFFTPHHGIELDYGYTRDTQQFLRVDTANVVHTDVHEATASYVWHYTTGVLTPFLSAGGGALVYEPMASGTFTPTPATTQARAAFVYSAGMDIALTRHLAIRQEYRAFVLRAPNFGTGVGSDAGQYISEAIIGFNWKL